MKLCECGCGNEVKEGNRFLVGHTNKGKKLSEEHKRKIGESSKGRIISKETREKLSKIHIGRKHSEELKRKLSEIRKGKPTWNKGKKMSEEWKKRVSKNFLGKKHTSEHRKKMRLLAIKRIEKQQLNGEPLFPCVGETERSFLDEIEILLGLKIHRQLFICGYFIDGYIPELRLAFEFDEISNHKNIEERDVQRQKEVEDALHCSFFRVSDLEWKNNKEEILNQIRSLKMT